ncbi:MAG: putative ABC transport system ATP-binding protein [Planctomycetota bacterium]|jgi:putative ABC transport system ATP-binding protein
MTPANHNPLDPSTVRALNQFLLAYRANPEDCDWNRTAVNGPESFPVNELERMLLALDPVRHRPELVDGDLDVAIRYAREGRPLLLDLGALANSSLEGDWLLLQTGGERELRTSVFGPGEEDQEFASSASDLARLLENESGSRLRWLTLDQPGAKDTTSGAPAPTPLARLGRLLRADRADLLAIGMYAVAMGVLLLATPIAVQAVVNFIALGGAYQPLVVVTMFLLLVLAFAGVLAALQAWMVEVLQRRLFARTVANLAARLPRVAIDVYDRRDGPELVNRFFDVMTIQKAGSALLLDGLSILLTVVVGLVLLAFYHPLLLAFDILLLAAITLIVLGPIRRGVRSAISESVAKYSVAEWLEDLTRHPVLFRSAGVRSWILQNSDRVVGDYLEKRASHFRVLFAQIISASVLHVLASTALLGLGGFLVIRGSLTLGQLVAAELVVTMIVGSVAKIGKQLENFYDLMAATDKVGFLMDLPLETEGGEHFLPPTGSRGATLELRQLSASAPGGPPLFQNVSVRVEPGSSLAIRGPSGCGKSALLEHLWSLRRPMSGSVRLDGHDLRTLSLDASRSSASLLSQLEVVTGDVRQNVSLGRVLVSESDVRSALDRVGLLDVLERLPDGLVTSLNTRGWPLSDSEICCLQVARVIVSEPRLLIVSDGMLPVGGAHRKRLLDVLFDPASRWTLVISSNASDVLERCDQILELPEGTVSSWPREPLPQSV